MAKCTVCGADHGKDAREGTSREAAYRVERWGPPFETLWPHAWRKGYEPVELRATQRDDGAWDATVYAASYEALAYCEVGSFEFRGIAATEDRAKRLARDAAAAAVRKWEDWSAKWDAEREAART